MGAGWACQGTHVHRPCVIVVGTMNVTLRNFGLSAYIFASAHFGAAQVRAASVSVGSHAPLVFYATSPGGETLDQGDGGGNPFASSLIDLMGRPTLSLSGLSSELTTLTYQKSHGYQTPEVPAPTS